MPGQQLLLTVPQGSVPRGQQSTGRNAHLARKSGRERYVWLFKNTDDTFLVKLTNN